MFDSPASQLEKTQSTLGTLRNARSRPATINDLPAEILSYIFTFARVYCKLKPLLEYEVDSRSFARDNLSPVCVHWRRVCINTPLLWTHIDLSIDEHRLEKYPFYAQRSLERAKQLPLYVHVDDYFLRSGGPQPVINLLVPYANRIVSLDLEVNAWAARSILLGLFGGDYQGSVRDLHLSDANYLANGDGKMEFSSLGAFLLSLKSLSLLSGPSLAYNSPAFRGLIELTISSDIYFEPKPSELVQILTSCPELRSLALVDIIIAGGDPPVNIAQLPNLEILDLRCTPFEDVLSITSCISPGSSALSMSISLDMTNSDLEEVDLSLLQPFFERSHVTRISLDTGREQEVDLGPFIRSLGSVLPLLEELALEGRMLRHSHVEGCLWAERFPRLHTLHVMGESVLVNKLKTILAFSSIRTVRLRSRYPHSTNISQALSKVVPCVSYSPPISSVVKQLSCEWPSTGYLT